MNEAIEMFVAGGVLIGLTSGLVQAFKMVGFPKKYCGLLSVVMGVFITMMLGKATTIGNEYILGLIGIAVGLSAVGLYSGGYEAFFKKAK